MASSHYPQPNSEPTYTVFIRLPFPRADFVDPPPVNWDSSKDEALWKIVSKVSKTEIDWNEVASRFQVTVDFLLQQVAFLTERHAAQLRAQMRKAAAAVRGSPAPSPQPGAESPFLAEMLRRAGSGQPRAPSSLTIRKDSPMPRNDNSVPGTPIRTSSRPTVAHTSSSGSAVTTTRNLGGGSKVAAVAAAAAAAANRSSTDAQRKRMSSLPIATSADEVDDADGPPSPGPADTSSAASSTSSSSSPAQSRIIRRPPRFQSNDVSSSFADDDDDDAEPAFLPYNPPSDGSSGHDLSATLRGNSRDFARRLPKGSARDHTHHSQTSDSSASSAAVFVQGASDRNKPGAPMSPRRTMELTGRSPGGKGKGYSRDSDGTPSMGSSFSDLDDASVTQSALEEAMASKMGDAGTTIGSLKGTISNAFRSRYLPKPGGNP